MLLLTRKRGEKIIIGDSITLSVKWIVDSENVKFKLEVPQGTTVTLGNLGLPTESVEKPVIKWKKPLSRLIKME